MRTMMPTRRARREVRTARRVYLQTPLGIFRISKAEALRVLKPSSHVQTVPVQQFRDSVCLDTYGPAFL